MTALTELKMSKKIAELWEDENSFEQELETNTPSNENNFAELLAQSETRQDLQVHPGDKIQAVISYLGTGDDVILELGGKQTGVISKKELINEGITPKVGDTIEAFVLSSKDGEIILSKAMSHKLATENALETAYVSKIPVKGKV